MRFIALYPRHLKQSDLKTASTTNLMPIRGDVSTVLQLSFNLGFTERICTYSKPYARGLKPVNLTNLILTNFSLLIEPLASPRIAEGR